VPGQQARQIEGLGHARRERETTFDLREAHERAQHEALDSVPDDAPSTEKKRKPKKTRRRASRSMAYVRKSPKVWPVAKKKTQIRLSAAV
jgi:hypothetical protein